MSQPRAEQRQRAAHAGTIFTHRTVLQQRTVSWLHQPAGKLAISGVIKGQLTIKLQHKFLAAHGIERRGVKFRDFGIDAWRQRIGGRIEITHPSIQPVGAALDLVRIAVINDPGHRQIVQMAQILVGHPM